MINEANAKKLSALGITVVAATKTRSVEDINALKKYGIKIAGESRVQEFLQKHPHCDTDWHFIGRLQTNKVKYIVDKVKMIQSLDRVSLAEEIQRQCEKINVIMDVLLQINLGEDSKGGAGEAEIKELFNFVNRLKNLRAVGLMALPPIKAKEAVYKHVSNIYNQLKDEFGLKYLSMGMSADYEIAVKHGANIIRPGSVLFDGGHK